MPGTLNVALGHYHVGELTNISGDYNVFAFSDQYLEDADRPVLSQSLLDPSGKPRRKIPRTHVVAPAFFSNLLPETDGLLRAMIARQYQINIARDFPFLNVLGNDLPGAIETSPHGEIRERSSPLGRFPFDVPLSTPALRFSLAGLQLKFSVSMKRERLTLPAHGNSARWIVKLPAPAYSRLPENEFHVMSFARLIGLDVPAIALTPLADVDGLPDNLPELREDEPPIAYAIQRFDRTSTAQRIHCEDLNQVADQKPRDKYENKAMYWVAGVVRTLCPSADVDELFARLTFGICIGNNDMHLKNWSISYPNGRDARLSPVYDFVCTTRYFPKGDLALTVGGTRAFEEIDLARLENVAGRAGVSQSRVRVVVRETIEKIRSAWPQLKASIPDEKLIRSIESNFARVPLMRG